MTITKKILCLLGFAAAAALPLSAVEIVPKPVSMEETGGSVSLSGTIEFYASDPELSTLPGTWEEMYAPLAGVKPAKKASKADVLLEIDPALEDEEYSLSVDPASGQVTIAGGSAAGTWWGMQTLSQLLVQGMTAKGFSLPGLSISDKPAFGYRGGHMDCCRHFFTTENVKKFIDILAMHKLNTFHWHLTDDQGWRIEIRKYPRLTEVGSVRKETLVGHLAKDNNTYDGTPHGGFYTQDEIREIVAYAAARQITVIPEIEMPGHALAALASYPELGCRGDGYEVATTWGVFPEIFCAGNPGTVRFLEDVLDEVCDLFPSEYIHIGGDEAPTESWENCPVCQAKKEELGLDDVAWLHGYLLKTIEDYLNARGRKIIGWDEILDAGVTPTATIMSWRGPAGGKRAAKQGNDVIMTPNIYLYLDYYQTDDPQGKGEPLGIGGCVPLSKVYSFDPYDELDEEARPHIKGVQANLWAEYIADFDHLQMMILPRYCALSEDAWGSEKEDFASFRQRVGDAVVPLYEILGLNYAPYGFE